MTVTGLIDKFAELESQISAERGGFTLFVLVMREEAADLWDLIVSAPWAGGDRSNTVDYFVSQIKSRLGERTLLSLSRIVVVEPENSAVQDFNREFQIEHGRVEVRDTSIFGLPVKRSYIITSRRPPAPAAA
jgi:hypothetical protein